MPAAPRRDQPVRPNRGSTAVFASNLARTIVTISHKIRALALSSYVVAS